jgi:hypothetical protein
MCDMCVCVCVYIYIYNICYMHTQTDTVRGKQCESCTVTEESYK